ncbi:hypothetical protein V8C26DRAFT_114990 [Trichoderma gracile]
MHGTSRSDLLLRAAVLHALHGHPPSFPAASWHSITRGCSNRSPRRAGAPPPESTIVGDGHGRWRSRILPASVSAILPRGGLRQGPKRKSPPTYHHQRQALESVCLHVPRRWKGRDEMTGDSRCPVTLPSSQNGDTGRPRCSMASPAVTAGRKWSTVSTHPLPPAGGLSDQGITKMGRLLSTDNTEQMLRPLASSVSSERAACRGAARQGGVTKQRASPVFTRSGAVAWSWLCYCCIQRCRNASCRWLLHHGHWQVSFSSSLLLLQC